MGVRLLEAGLTLLEMTLFPCGTFTLAWPTPRLPHANRVLITKTYRHSVYPLSQNAADSRRKGFLKKPCLLSDHNHV